MIKSFNAVRKFTHVFFWQEQMRKVREEREAVAVAAWFLTW